MKSPARMRRGFTLLELSVVLVLIGTVMSMALVTLTGSIQATQYNATVARMDAIEKALLNFAVANNRIPCPSDLTQVSTSATYGLEAGAGSGSFPATATGACTGASMTPVANYKSTSGAVEGGVPTRALQLPDDYIYDGWGRRFRYAVDPTYTKSSALPAAASCTGTVTPDASAITVNDATGAARTTAGIYALISHGANGHGAYTSNGVTLNAGSSSANELTNCHCTSAGVYNGTYTPTYVEKVPQYDSGESGVAAYYFDDIVTFKEAWQMQAQNYPLSQTVAQCVYVADSGNARVQVFNTSGAYISQFGSSGTGSGQFNTPSGIAIDASGNIWVTDYGNQTVQKFSSTGVWLQTIGNGTWGCGNNQFNEADGIAIDASGNLWVTDKDGNRIQEFNSSGTYVKSIGAGYNGVSGTPCSSGTGNGQFSFVEGNVGIDASGNIWVNDAGNGRVQEFTSSGTWLQTIPMTYWQNGLALDSSGNFWMDWNLYNVEKFTSSGADTGIHLNMSNCGGGSCEGPANGDNYGRNEFAIDPSGNIWITDPYNNRVQEFTSSGTWLQSIGGPSPYTCETSPAGSMPSCAAGTANGQFNFYNGFGGIAIGSR